MKISKSEENLFKKMIGTYGIEKLRQYIVLNNVSSEKTILDLISILVYDFIKKIERQNKYVVKQHLEGKGWDDKEVLGE